MVHRDEGRIQKGRKERPEKNAEETKDGDVAQAIQPHRAADKITDATGADERLTGIADKPAKNHALRDIALQPHQPMGRKGREEQYPPGALGVSKRAASKIELGGQRTETGCG